MSWNVKYASLILFSTCATYVSALAIAKVRKRSIINGQKRFHEKLVLITCLFVNIGVLIFFKYYDFVFINLSLACSKVGIQLQYPKFDILLPVGISFYTFQAFGYIIDVYRGKIEAENNFLKYALFVSFFPQLVAGPIERSKNLLKQINRPTSFDVNNARYGLLTMAYGFFLKIVVADNIANAINPILSDYCKYPGMMTVICMILFAFQIYCDFHGYTQIAIGSAQILGYRLQENFNAPYLAGNIKEFWRNWHISLTSWFTDYLYIPLGGNRKGKFRKYVNTLIVFLISGLWHGASWAFIAWAESMAFTWFYMILSEIYENY